LKIKIYGTRGSFPSLKNGNGSYGGNTACVRVDTHDKTILLDAGTGISRFAAETNARDFSCEILLSHLHLDHIMGFLSLGNILGAKNDVRIYTKSRGNAPLAEQIFGAFKPPFWPIKFSEFCKAQAIEIFDDVPFMLGEKIKITPFKAEHPNDTSAFRIDADKSLVYLADYEINENSTRYEELSRFCENADLVILDTAYLPKDYPLYQGWGHSTYQMGISLAERCNCKQMMFFHFAQDYSDEELDTIPCTDRFFVAREGMEFEI